MWMIMVLSTRLLVIWEGAISGNPIQTYSTATRQFPRAIPALRYRPQWLHRHREGVAFLLQGRDRSRQGAWGRRLLRLPRGGTCVRDGLGGREGEGNRVAVVAGHPNHNSADLHNDAFIHFRVKTQVTGTKIYLILSMIVATSTGLGVNW